MQIGYAAGMWVPRPIYEALPGVYVAIGVAMIVLLVYMAEASLQAIFYGGVAVACLVAGGMVHRKRISARQKSPEVPSGSDGDGSPEAVKY